MRIYNYILRINPEAKNVFTEQIVDDAQEVRDGWTVSKGTWDNTKYYREMQMSNTMYQPVATVASEVPIPNAKQLLCKFVEDKVTEQLMKTIEESQNTIVWLREESMR